MLRAAGIERARSVMACVDSDAENIFTCLTARELRSDITIVARASVEDSEKKLLRAGADRVISPYKSSGAEMARLALQPQVTGVVDVAPEYRMEEIVVGEGCAAAGRTIGEVSGTAMIAAVRDADGRMHPQPAGSTVLAAGDVWSRWARGTPSPTSSPASTRPPVRSAERRAAALGAAAHGRRRRRVEDSRDLLPPGPAPRTVARATRRPAQAAIWRRGPIATRSSPVHRVAAVGEDHQRARRCRGGCGGAGRPRSPPTSCGRAGSPSSAVQGPAR